MPEQPDNSALRNILEASNEADLFSITSDLLSSFHISYFSARTARRNSGLPQHFMRSLSDRTSSLFSELSNSPNDPVSRISRNTFVPYDLFRFRREFENDRLITEFYQKLEKDGVNPFYVFSSHIPEADVQYFFVNRTDGEELTPMEQYILQGVFLYVSLRRSHFIRSDEAKDKISALTKRETEVLYLMAQGLTDRDISQKLHISLVTVGFHVKNAKQKLGARNKCHAIYLSGIGGESLFA